LDSPPVTLFFIPGDGMIRYPSFITKRPDYQDLRGVNSAQGGHRF
jgi:hypothetical protein